MVFAPEGWIIVDKMVEPGEQIARNTPVAKASDYRTLVVPISVSGEELAQMRKAPDKFNASLEQTPVKAKIRWVNPEFDEKTRKLAIELIILDYPGEKIGGLLFSSSFDIPAPGIQVPKAAVFNRYENPRVKIKTTGETINVTLMGESDGRFIIADHPKLTPGTELSLPDNP
jgi:hypothetical protein